jgi:hypothetical protein
MPPKNEPFTEQIYRLYFESGCTQAQIRHATGLDRAIISRFVNRTGFLSPKALNLIADYLGLEVRVNPRKRKS